MADIKILEDGGFSIYSGKVYASHRTADKKIVLLSTDIKDVEEKGFEACEPFEINRHIDLKRKVMIVCKKKVDKSELDDDYRRRVHVKYEGYEFSGGRLSGDMICIWADNLTVAEKLGMKMVEMGLYKSWIPIKDAELMVIKESYIHKGEKSIEVYSGKELLENKKSKEIKTYKNMDTLDIRDLKKGRFSIYMGKPYLTRDIINGEVILYSADICDVEENGFEPCEPYKAEDAYISSDCREKIVCEKKLEQSVLEERYIQSIRAQYEGYEYDVIEHEGNMICIHTKYSHEAEGHGMKEKETEIPELYGYEKWIPMEEAEILIIKDYYMNKDIEEITVYRADKEYPYIKSKEKVRGRFKIKKGKRNQAK